MAVVGRQIRDRFGLNSIIGALLLVMLVSLAGDEIYRSIVSQIPGVDEAAPCAWLPSPDDLANRQSLIGRAAVERVPPLELRVRSSAIPTTADELLVIRILVINNTLGTVPFVYNPNEVIVGDNNTSGLGIIFDPPSNIFTTGVNTRSDAATYPADELRVIGPQQRCVHRMEFSFDQLDGTIRSGNATVTAYYRGNNVGTIPAANPTPIYPDQGLYTGLILSSPVEVLAAPAPAPAQ